MHRMIQHDTLRNTNCSIELTARVDNPQPRGCSDLIVSAPACVKLRRNLTDLVVKHSVDHGVNIFVGWERGRSCREFLADFFQSFLNAFALFEREYTGTPKSD